MRWAEKPKSPVNAGSGRRSYAHAISTTKSGASRNGRPNPPTVLCGTWGYGLALTRSFLRRAGGGHASGGVARSVPRATAPMLKGLRSPTSHLAERLKSSMHSPVERLRSPPPLLAERAERLRFPISPLAESLRQMHPLVASGARGLGRARASHSERPAPIWRSVPFPFGAPPAWLNSSPGHRHMSGVGASRTGGSTRSGLCPPRV
mmetsp:Transcript_7987/g.26291  ORF Transcript_7987/g.26291 Transcript_7987/m.26291 type:complete len:206 (-) Transcript_7987:771-1388(-)|eukprot:scaffold4344_cov114-Isochrysis_galbana.AAC.4